MNVKTTQNTLTVEKRDELNRNELRQDNSSRSSNVHSNLVLVICMQFCS